jgi:hypothetical protein
MRESSIQGLNSGQSWMDQIRIGHLINWSTASLRGIGPRNCKTSVQVPDNGDTQLEADLTAGRDTINVVALNGAIPTGICHFPRISASPG